MARDRRIKPPTYVLEIPILPMGNNMERKKILLDVDEVICFPAFLPLINEFLHTDYKIDDFKCYYLEEEAIPKERFMEFTEFIKNRNLYENATIIPNAPEVIEKLSKIYDIFICSSCINPFAKEASGKLFSYKYDFLLANLPFLKPENYVFTNAKFLLQADVQIDDYLPNLEQNKSTVKILFPSYHNKDISEEILKEKHILRAGYDWQDGWVNVEKILIEQEKELTLTKKKK